MGFALLLAPSMRQRKKTFDALGGKPIPKVAQLSQEYAALLTEKKAEYERYKALHQDMIVYRIAKQNVDRILGLEQEPSTKENRSSDNKRGPAAK